MAGLPAVCLQCHTSFPPAENTHKYASTMVVAGETCPHCGADAQIPPDGYLPIYQRIVAAAGRSAERDQIAALIETLERLAQVPMLQREALAVAIKAAAPIIEDHLDELPVEQGERDTFVAVMIILTKHLQRAVTAAVRRKQN